MSDSSDRKKHPLIPPEESRCVWMTAGILSYQLCEREFGCEQCPLDIALRQRFVNHQAVGRRKASITDARTAEEQQVGVLYGRKHVWVRVQTEHSVRLGIEPGLASVVLSPHAVVLPVIGDQVIHNKVCAWIVMEGGTLPIVSPISGKVSATNSHLAENPHAVSLSPLGQGWLFEVSVERAVTEDADLLPVADAARAYAEDERRFQALLAAELTKGGAVVGKTLADGGEALGRICEMLGSTKYFRVLRSVFI